VELGRLRAIDPRHREAAATGSLRDSLEMHPANLLVLSGFFVSEVAERLAGFLGEEARYRIERRLFSSPDPVDEARWATANDHDRLSSVRRVAGAGSSPALGRGAIEYLRVRSLLGSGGFRSFLEIVSGRALAGTWGVGACRLDAGDFVRPHRYDPGTCQLRLEVFLAPRWQAGSGGDLCVIDDHERVTCIPALFNRAVVLDTSLGNTYLVAPRRHGGVAVPRLSLEASFGPGAAGSSGDDAARETAQPR
jgi:hypothetical protein